MKAVPPVSPNPAVSPGPPAPKPAGTLRADLSLLITGLIWGTGFAASQFAIDAGLSTSLILLLRFTIAAGVLGIILFPRLAHTGIREWKRGILAGTLMFAAFYSQTVGLRFTTPSNNAFITAANVVMVPFITWFLLKKAPPLRSFILSITTLGGVALLSYGPGAPGRFAVGDAYTLLCAFLFAGHIAYLDRASKSVNPGVLTFIQMLTASLLSLIFFGIGDRFRIHPPSLAAGLPAVLYLGLFSTLLCFFIQTRAQRRTTSTKAAIFLSTEALFGALFSVMLGLEPFSWSMPLGGGIILLSITAAELLTLRTLGRTPKAAPPKGG